MLKVFKFAAPALLFIPAFIFGGPGGKKKIVPGQDTIIYQAETKWIQDSIGCYGYRFDFNFHNRLADYFKFYRDDVLSVFGRPDVTSEDGKIFEYWIKAPDLCGKNKSVEDLKKLGYDPQQSIEFHFNDSLKVSGIFKREY